MRRDHGRTAVGKFEDITIGEREVRSFLRARVIESRENSHMSKSALAASLDDLQTHLDPLLQARFRGHGRTYNRTTADGLTHVVGFQMGRFDPPGTTYIPGLRENLYGRPPRRRDRGRPLEHRPPN